jgi:uncharacterized protein YyaL (SSP411 family)
MDSKKTENSHFRRNNLDKSSSPYLLQHIANPIWWQEWSLETLSYARDENKPLFVSIGYATCHWCHVMAVEAFSDEDTASYLNRNFICIKVDREQRPDIDQFMMEFINKQNGRGGWPLNVFLTNELHPIFALTYAPVVARNSMTSFLSVSEQVVAYYKNNINAIPEFVSTGEMPVTAEENTVVKMLSEYYDSENGGFGYGQKFPSHSTILYLLYQISIDNSPSIRTIIHKTLGAMYHRGLHDHLQGGIFRYCVDSGWTIPHFEKMLYDQAMALWIYSLAYRITGTDEYKIMSEGILRCLDESFEADGLYISAHDADTGHQEGATYLWSYDQLKNELSPYEFDAFAASYYITKQGNFEGLNHLIRKNDKRVQPIEDKLLSIRRARKQPSRDDKIVSGMNALVAIAMIQAGRLLGKPDLEKKAAIIIDRVIELFWDGRLLGHSYFDGVLQKQQFLSDASAIHLAVTLLYESDPEQKNRMNEFTAYVESFNEGGKWIESDCEDFRKIYASWFDHPVPSGASMAEMGLTRAAILNSKEITFSKYLQPFQSDFHNIVAMMNNGLFHIYTTRKFIPWNKLPVNSIQLRGEHETDCFMGTCYPLLEPIN